MIKSITTKNFGVLEDGTRLFTDGLNLIKGENEGGKSTLIEASLYALFGASIIRGSVEEATTRGTSGLKVVVEYDDYVIKRSKSSASVVGTGVKISGQGKVSEFFYDLFDLNKSVIENVVIANQGDSAGILNGRPAEVTELIEQLAGFDQIDDIIERVKLKYPTGNKSVYEEMVLDNEEKITNLDEVVDSSPVQKELDGVTADREVFIGKVKGAEETVQIAREALVTVEASNREKLTLGKRVEDFKKQLDKAVVYRQELEVSANISISDAVEEEAYVVAFPTLQEKHKLYSKIISFEPWEGDTWEGNLLSLKEELENQSGVKDKCIGSRRLLKHKILTELDKVNSGETCRECGQNIKHLHAEINAAAKIKVAGHEAELIIVEADFKDTVGMIETLNSIIKAQAGRTDYEKFATVNPKTLPWDLQWHGVIPKEPDTVKLKSCQKKITESVRELTKRDHAREQLPQTRTTVEDTQSKLSEAEIDHGDKIWMDPKILQEGVIETRRELQKKKQALEILENNISGKKGELLRLTSAAEQRQKRLEDLTKEKAELKVKIDTDNANGVILKEMRKAKPVVLSKVWNRVLAAVSTTFTNMRGEPSIVERREKGFYINDLPVNRLSGSAKSILGIAIRQTLRDVFAPSAGFLVFDEPAADCDGNRTAAVFSTIKSIPGQVIVITHEDVSDTLADNIIEV